MGIPDDFVVAVGRNRWVSGGLILSGAFLFAVSWLGHQRMQTFTGALLLTLGALHWIFPALRVSASEVALVSIFGFATRRYAYAPEEIRLERGRLTIGNQIIPLSAISVRAADIETLTVFLAEAKLRN